MKGDILIIEDTQEWRESLRSLLESEGYRVFEASTAAEAMELLTSRPFHIALVDISLRYQDENDESGMNLLAAMKKRGLDRVVQSIVISGYGTRRRMRRAFVDYNVADFIPKDEFDTEEFLDIVRRVFETEVKVNPNLTILPPDLNFPSLFVNTTIEGKRIRKRNTPEVDRYANELKELLRRLFYSADSILVSPISKGFSGTGVLRVQAVYKDSGVSAPMIVKFGDKTQIDQEYKRFKRYVEGFIGAGRTASIVDHRYTNSLGGIVYQFLGTDVGSWTNLGDYYRTHSLDEIEQTFRDLFYVTTANWYANRSSIEPMPLIQTYLDYWGIESLDHLQELVFIGKLKRYKSQGNMFHLAGQPQLAIANPFPLLQQRSWIYLTIQCITHGDLNLQNVLVDKSGSTWLIDFYGTGRGHILRDITELETQIKLLLSDEASLDDLFLLEKRLAQDRLFSEITYPRLIPEDLPETVKKIYQSVGLLRFIASDLVKPQRIEGFGEYQVTIAMQSLNLARMLYLTEKQRLHALISASFALQSATAQ